MFTEPVTARRVVLALVVLGCGAAAGLLVRALLRSTLGRRAPSMERAPAAHAARWLGLMAVGLLSSAGAYAGSLVLPLTDRARAVSGKAILSFVIAAATLSASRLVGGLVRAHADRGGAVGTSSILGNVARLTTLLLGALVLLQSLGVSIAPLLTALGVGGLAVALALQETLANLFAGLQILASKKVVPGDFVQLDSGEDGYVVDINWRNTALRSLRNNVVLVPNARIASASLTNYHQPSPEMSVLVGVGVGYESDLEHVERVTTEVARQAQAEIEGAVRDYEPFIRYTDFGDSSIDFNVILRVSEPTAQHLLRHEFVKRLHARYGKENIEIPFPIRTIAWKTQQVDLEPSDVLARLGRRGVDPQ
ncbi:MAG: mechanosensitive ion channel family protein [Actinomycetota bacterium]